ncbi:MAG TPA: PQQ-binding-like beta-propeller repeat protein [Vicinamibacteria bacterium]
MTRSARPAAVASLAATSLALAALARPAAERPAAPPPEREWRAHGGDPGHTQHSPLAQITPANVSRLRVAWTYRTGDAREGGRSQIQCNPIVVDGVLYATSAGLEAFALDAATGRERWRFDPFAAGAEESALGVNRGVVYWSDGRERRILYSAGQVLFALDASTGTLVPGFGTGGRVDLREGLGRDPKSLFVLSTTPGAVYQDLLVLGTRVHEGPGPSAPGHVRAYDVRTGTIRWTFRTIPRPGEPGHETWPKDAWKTAGGANAWSGISVDPARGLVFVPTGSPAFDFWGGDRHGENLFGNCVLALRARTGERVWHYQLVRHDLWDRDPPQAPVLLDVKRDGRTVDAVAQATKSGHVFVLERETGKPLLPIEERKVPPSDLDGEETWPSQPVPVKPPAFSRQAFTEAEATDLSPASRAAVLARLRQVRSGGQFVPPSTEGTMIFPGFDGGAEWGGSAFDPETRLLYVNANEMPWILEMLKLPPPGAGGTLGSRVYAQHCAVCHGADRRGDPQGQFPSLERLAEKSKAKDVVALLENGKGVMPAFAFLSRAEREASAAFVLGEKEEDHGAGEAARAGRPYTHLGYNRFLDPEGYPAVKPPWGTLNAIDLDAGEVRWSVTLGELPELTRRGIPPTGTENYGGPIVTAGGLVFIGATKDERFRAFDKKTGKVLWETSLPAGGYATPATYEAGGRQYVVIAAGGGKMGTKSGDAYVAFALPD